MGTHRPKAQARSARCQPGRNNVANGIRRAADGSAGHATLIYTPNYNYEDEDEEEEEEEGTFTEHILYHPRTAVIIAVFIRIINS